MSRPSDTSSFPKPPHRDRQYPRTTGHLLPDEAAPASRTSVTHRPIRVSNEECPTE